MLDHRQDGMTTRAARVGIPDPLDTIRRLNGDSDQLKKRVISVLGVDQNFGKRHIKQLR